MQEIKTAIYSKEVNLFRQYKAPENWKVENATKEIFELWEKSKFQEIKRSKKWDLNKVEDLIVFRKTCMTSLEEYVKDLSKKYYDRKYRLNLFVTKKFREFENNKKAQNLFQSLRQMLIDDKENKGYGLSSTLSTKNIGSLFDNLRDIDSMEKVWEFIKALEPYDYIKAVNAKQNFSPAEWNSIERIAQTEAGIFTQCSKKCFEYLISEYKKSDEKKKGDVQQILVHMNRVSPKTIEENEVKLAQNGLNICNRTKPNNELFQKIEYMDDQKIDSVICSFFISILLYLDSFPDNKLGFVTTVSDHDPKKQKQREISQGLKKKIEENKIGGVEFLEIKPMEGTRSLFYENKSLNQESIALLKGFIEKNGEKGTLLFFMSGYDSKIFDFFPLESCLGAIKNAAQIKSDSGEIQNKTEIIAAEKNKILSYTASISAEKIKNSAIIFNVDVFNNYSQGDIINFNLKDTDFFEKMLLFFEEKEIRLCFGAETGTQQLLMKDALVMSSRLKEKSFFLFLKSDDPFEELDADAIDKNKTFNALMYPRELGPVFLYCILNPNLSDEDVASIKKLINVYAEEALGSKYIAEIKKKLTLYMFFAIVTVLEKKGVDLKELQNIRESVEQELVETGYLEGRKDNVLAAMMPKSLESKPQSKEKQEASTMSFSLLQSTIGMFGFSGSQKRETIRKEDGSENFLEIPADSKSSADSKFGNPVLNAFGAKEDVLVLLGCKDIEEDVNVGTSCLVFSNLAPANKCQLKIQKLLAAHGKTWSCTVEKEEKVTVIFSSAQMWLITSYLLLKQTVDEGGISNKKLKNLKKDFMSMIDRHFMSLESAYDNSKIMELSSSMIDACAGTENELKGQYEKVFSQIQLSRYCIKEENPSFMPKGGQQNQQKSIPNFSL